MKKSRIFFALVMALAAMAGCIKNDIPYPRIQANFLQLVARGQTAATAIDSTLRVATITFPEETDIYNVTITDYELTPGASIVDNPFNSPVNLSAPIFVTLQLYQDYEWKIVGLQDIERYFDVAGQMGTSVIDVPGHRVVLYVREGTDLAKLQVDRVKLSNVGATMVPDLSNGGTINAKSPVTITVTTFGREETWTVYVETVEAAATTVSVDAWSGVAWVHGQAEAGKDNGVEYRLAGTTEWTRVPASDVTHDGGSFTGRINDLSPMTQYETRVYSDTDFGDILEFTTGSEPQIPNGDFEFWWLDGKVWCPWEEGHDAFWGTGNIGASTLGNSNTTPTEDTPSGSGLAARLETRFVGIGALGKLAAGNLFAGSYLRTVGTNGVLSFGRPFTERPTKMQGQFKYNMVDISHTYGNEYADLVGRPDTCIVWIALIDSAEPFEIRTAPSDRQLFDPAGPEVVAYGQMQMGETVPGYIPFEIELNYTSTSRVPKYILITASASKYGDYFTGGNGSTLYIDDFKLVYHY